MYISILADFFEDKIKFYLPFSSNLVNCDSDDFEFDDITLLESNNINIDINLLNNRIKDKLKDADYKYYNERFIECGVNKKLKKNDTIILNDINNEFKEDHINLTLQIIQNSVDNKNLMYNFIKNNKDLNINIYVTDYKELIENLGIDEYPNLKIDFKNSESSLSYKEFYKMYLMLNEIVTFVNHYNLSPLEKVMLVYDIVKANKYQKEDEGDDYGVSRDLNQIIGNDKIVCVGFSNLLDFLLTNLGIDSKFIEVGYRGKETAHQRNCIHLKDDKYGIDGMFFLDATWDSNKSNNYIDNYRYFLKPLIFFKKRFKNEYVIVPKSFELLQKNPDDVVKLLKSEDYMVYTKTITKLYSLKSMFNKDDKDINYVVKQTMDDQIEFAEDVLINYNQRISKNQFKNALYKVRRIEFLNKLINFEPNEEYINEICEKYFPSTPELNFFISLGIEEKPTLEKDLEEIKSSSVKEDLLRLRIIKALKEKTQDFPENEYIKKM